jgi:hypothetical protein
VPPSVSERIDAEDADAAHEAARHLGSREHRLALAGLAQDDRVVALVGEPIEHDRRAGRPCPAIQVPRRLVQVRCRVEQRRGEARAVEIAFTDGARVGSRQRGRPGGTAAERRSLHLDAPAPGLEPQGLQPLGQGGAVGCSEQQHGVDEVDAPGARGHRSPGGDRGCVESLALHVRDLAPLCGQPVARPDDPQARRHERHRLGTVQGPDAHRGGGETLEREQPREPAWRNLARPATAEVERGDQVGTLGAAGADPVGRAGPGDTRPQAGERRSVEPPVVEAALLGDAPDKVEGSGELGLRRRVDQQDRPSRRPRRRGRDLVVVGGVRSEDPLASRVDRGADGVEVLARAAAGSHGEELEGSRDGVVQRGEVLEGGLLLGLGHELEVQRRELEAAALSPAHPECPVVDRSDGPGRRRCAGRGRPGLRWQQASHGAAAGLKAR